MKTKPPPIPGPPPESRRTAVWLALTGLLFLIAAVAWLSLPAHHTVSSTAEAYSPGYRINVNTADAPTLRLLPGLGPTIAQRVVDERAAHGPFKNIQDIQRVQGIGTILADHLTPYVQFNASGGN